MRCQALLHSVHSRSKAVCKVEDSVKKISKCFAGSIVALARCLESHHACMTSDTTSPQLNLMQKFSRSSHLNMWVDAGIKIGNAEPKHDHASIHNKTHGHKAQLASPAHQLPKLVKRASKEGSSFRY